MTTINLSWAQPDERNEYRHDSCWYTYGQGHDLIVTVSRGDREIGVYADGEMDIRVFTQEDGKFAEFGRIRYCEDLAEYGITTDPDLWGLPYVDDTDLQGPNKAGFFFRFDHNSWFDLYSADGEHLDCVNHELGDAIGQATAIIDDDTDELWQAEEK